MQGRLLSHISAQALVPEQILSYVAAVGQSQPCLYGDCVGYDYDGHVVLIAYKPGMDPENGADARQTLNAAVAAALEKPLTTLTVLGPERPQAAPENAFTSNDVYWGLPLPLPAPGQKLRNMLRRGARECTICQEQWGGEHASLVNAYLETRPLEDGTRHIYRHIPEYLATTPDALLLAARARTDGRLLAFCIGDFSSLSTAMYMFAFRHQHCPPGVADALLLALARTGEERGHQRLNLGLGINRGIVFFKQKWGAFILLPCAETSWQPHAAGAARTRGAKTTDRQDPAAADPLAAIGPPPLRQRLARFFTGREREFACAQIEVTSHCPGRCSYCPHTTKQAVWRSRHMQDATFAALAPLLVRTQRVHLQGWGEPLRHPRFFDYVAAARRAGCAVSFTSYGLGMTETVAGKLVRSGADIVAFSLTGTDEASNAARVGVPFAKVREAILTLNRVRKKAARETPAIHLAYLMLASGMEAVKGLPDLMRDLNVPVAVVSTLDYIPEPQAASEAFDPADAPKTETARQLLQATADKAHSMGLDLYYSLPGPTGRNECNEQIQNCLYVDAEGQLSPCIYVNLPTNEDDPCRRVFGKVTEQDPMQIWNSPAFVAFRRRMTDGDPDLPCVRCAKRFERMF